MLSQSPNNGRWAFSLFARMSSSATRVDLYTYSYYTYLRRRPASHQQPVLRTVPRLPATAGCFFCFSLARRSIGAKQKEPQKNSKKFSHCWRKFQRISGAVQILFLIILCLQNKLYGTGAREKKTLCTQPMQFGNRNFVLFIDAVATLCSIVPTYSSMLKAVDQPPT
jgi:hypothetical protein